MHAKNPFDAAIKKDWYTQGFNAVPLYLGLTGYSGIVMKKQLGYGYSSFLYHYQNRYGEMSYLNSDLARLWGIIKKKISERPEYLRQIRERYMFGIKKNNTFYLTLIPARLAACSDDELIRIFRVCCKAQVDSVGAAHLVEIIGTEVEKEFRHKLLKAVGRSADWNMIYTSLSTPVQQSFLAREESELRRVRTDTQLAAHVQKYFWLQNSYEGPVQLSKRFFERRRKHRPAEKLSYAEVINKKNTLIRRFALDRDLRSLIQIIDFTSQWQDERKENILRGIGYLGIVVHELAKRSKVSEELIEQLGTHEALTLRSIHQLVGMRRTLGIRIRGSYFFFDGTREYIVSGRQHDRMLVRMTKRHQKVAAYDIHGSIANGGSAVGRAVICKGLASLKNVRKGDIIIASMTRPEFMPALKKAAAVVTDEGGITCHAAIVSRELNIPCIVGTKIATRVFHDGDIVDVRANHGIVRRV
jgi:phosphohistidine swiveling domain-containing protein